MTPPNPNAPQALSEEILADGRVESEEIIRRAKRQAESLLAQSTIEADKLRQERLAQARTEAARRGVPETR